MKPTNLFKRLFMPNQPEIRTNTLTHTSEKDSQSARIRDPYNDVDISEYVGGPNDT